MTAGSRSRGGDIYRFRIGGRLDQHWSAWFDHLTLTSEDDHTTTLTGVVTDQAELHGMLARIRDLGVPLISVTVVEAPSHPLDR